MTTDFSVMTYNIGNGLAPAGPLVDMLRETRHDIVGLQEVTPVQADTLEQHLKDIYPYRTLHGLGIPGKGLLSRYPIVESALVDLADNRPDLKATLNVHGVDVVFIIAHPLPPRFQRTGFHFKPVTRAQCSRLGEIAVAGEPTIMVGDFNMTDRHEIYADYCSLGLIDAFQVAGQGAGPTIPARVARLPFVPFLRIDYIWHTPHLRALHAEVGPDAGSDHLPVVAHFTWDA